GGFPARAGSSPACARARRAGAARRCPGAWRWPSATRPACPGCPTRAIARARRRARPGPDPRPPPRRARCESARLSTGPTRSARRRRSHDGWQATSCSILGGLLAQLLVGLAQLRRQLLTEVLGLEDLA